MTSVAVLDDVGDVVGVMFVAVTVLGQCLLW